MGSRHYKAPEVLNGQNYDAKIDVWGAMILICSLLTGKLPFEGRCDKDISEHIRNTDIQLYLEQFYPIDGTHRKNNHKQAVDFLVQGLKYQS